MRAYFYHIPYLVNFPLKYPDPYNFLPKYSVSSSNELSLGALTPKHPGQK